MLSERKENRKAKDEYLITKLTHTKKNRKTGGNKNKEEYKKHTLKKKRVAPLLLFHLCYSMMLFNLVSFFLLFLLSVYLVLLILFLFYF